MVKLHILPAGPIQTNAYLLTDPVRHEAVLIDAPQGVWPLVQEQLAKDGAHLVELWLTHGHWDHTQGAAEVARSAQIPVSGHAADRVMFEQPRVMADFMGGIELEPVKIDRWLHGGEKGEILGTAYEVRHVPGHCPGNVLFYFPALKAAFVGDALFKGSIGRTDLPGGDFAQLERSIRTQIYTLPGDTTVLPGHGGPTKVAAEMSGNPYVTAA